MKYLNRITNLRNPLKPLLVLCGVVRSLFISYICNRKFFTTRYLRCVGKQWSCPAYILPFFFKTPDERVTPRNLFDSVECPMKGNNWTPARPDGGERPTSFLKSQNLFNSRTCRFIMTHNWLSVKNRFNVFYTLLYTVKNYL